MKLILILFYLVCHVCISYSQDDLSTRFYANIEKKYLQKNVLVYNYQVTQFDSTGFVIEKTMKGKIHQAKTKFSYDLDNVKVAFEDSFYLMIYPDKKEMYYHIISDSLFKQTQSFDIQKFVSQLKENRIKVMIDSNCQDKLSDCYNLVYGKLDNDLYKIKINKKTGFIDFLRIDYYGASDVNSIQNYVLELRYSDYKTIDINSFHPLKDYVIKEPGVLTPHLNFKDFKISKF